MKKQFRPMLAATVEEEDIPNLKYPFFATPKIDGIRCLILPGGKVVSRTLKPIRNKFIRRSLATAFADTTAIIDGELQIAGPTCDEPKPFYLTSSAVMSEKGSPEFIYNIFDCITTSADVPYSIRSANIESLNCFGVPASCHIVNLPKVWGYLISDRAQLETYYSCYIEIGFEGIVLRSPLSPYKYGRSTLSEQYLLKLKPFVDSEARVLGFVELEHNTNPAGVDQLGYTERSSCQDGCYKGNMLGALEVEDIHTHQRFRIGTGFTQEQREDIWKHPENYRHSLIKYKYQKYGEKDKPRTPAFICFIEEED